MTRHPLMRWTRHFSPARDYSVHHTSCSQYGYTNGEDSNLSVLAILGIMPTRMHPFTPSLVHTYQDHIFAPTARVSVGQKPEGWSRTIAAVLWSISSNGNQPVSGCYPSSLMCFWAEASGWFDPSLQ